MNWLAHKNRISEDGKLDFAPSPTKTLSDRINKLIDKALEDENNKQKPRNYLGGSRLGVECLRALGFEWHRTPSDKELQQESKFAGKTIRRFQLGHLHEEETIRWLRLAGFDVRNAKPDGGQYGFSVGPDDKRIAGHIDGVVIGVPVSFKDLPHPLPWLWEHKIMNAKKWKECDTKGVKVSHPVYYYQCQVYMAYMDLGFAMFSALNTDTSELLHQFIEFNAQDAQWASDRGVEVVQSAIPQELPRITRDPQDFRCKFCDYKKTCWEQ